MSGFDIFKAISVRLVLLLHNIVTVWRVTEVWRENYYWLLVIANLPFIVEGIFTVFKRKGIEWKWVCPCFLFYLLSTMPGVWLLEIRRMKNFQAGMANVSALTDSINGINLPVRLNADTWILVIEESLLYFMILGRWFLPRGEVTREQLSELLFAFIGIASDIMELFALFDEDVVRGSEPVTYALLTIWTWSILQFTLVLTVSQRPRRDKRVSKINLALAEQKKGAKLEVLAIFISLLMQDGPFLALRLYVLIDFKLLTYSLVFFTAKNVLVILLLLYRTIIMCSKVCCNKESLTVKDIPFDLQKLEKGEIHTNEKTDDLIFPTEDDGSGDNTNQNQNQKMNGDTSGKPSKDLSDNQVPVPTPSPDRTPSLSGEGSLRRRKPESEEIETKQNDEPLLPTDVPGPTPSPDRSPSLSGEEGSLRRRKSESEETKTKQNDEPLLPTDDKSESNVNTTPRESSSNHLNSEAEDAQVPPASLDDNNKDTVSEPKLDTDYLKDTDPKPEDDGKKPPKVSIINVRL